MQFNNNKSLVCYQPKPRADKRLICFPCAGSGASMYRRWNSLLPEFEVWAANYPGRESLHSEPFAPSSDAIVERFFEQGDWLNEKPNILFGHSFGAFIAFKTALILEKQQLLAGLCVSARRAPQLPCRQVISQLPHNQFLKKLQSFGGLPDAIANNPDMLDHYLPIIRADLDINDREQTDKIINTDIQLFSGSLDHIADTDELSAWRNITKGRFSHKIVTGGHFFIQDNIDEFIGKLKASLNSFDQSEDDLIAF